MSTVKPAVKKTPKKKAKKKGTKVLVWNPDKKLTDKEELFLRYYVQNDETRMNGTHSYDMAYGKKLEEQDKEDAEYIEKEGRKICIKKSSYDRCYDLCKSEACRILTKPYIQARKVVLLNEMLTNEIVDAELVKVIKQDVDRPSKIRAINEYNKLGGRIVVKENHTHQFANEDMTDAELMERIKKNTAFFKKE